MIQKQPSSPQLICIDGPLKRPFSCWGCLCGSHYIVKGVGTIAIAVENVLRLTCRIVTQFPAKPYFDSILAIGSECPVQVSTAKNHIWSDELIKLNGCLSGCRQTYGSKPYSAIGNLDILFILYSPDY